MSSIVAQSRSRQGTEFLLHVLVAAATVVIPLILWRIDSQIIGSTYGEEYQLFELFGFSAAAALVIFTAVRFRRLSLASLQEALPLLLFLLVGFHYLTYLVEHSQPSWDYRCYESAAQSILHGGDPYTSPAEKCYLYPPLLAQSLAVVHQFVEQGSGMLGQETDSWFIVFYLYQTLQYFSILLTYYLAVQFARELGLQLPWAAGLVAALLLLNSPLIRTLKHNQVNLWMLDLFLAAVLLLPRSPTLAGFSLGLSVHLKLFTLVLVPVWAMKRRWKAILSTFASVIAIYLLQIYSDGDQDIWHQFFDYYRSQPLQRFMRYRNNSLQSVVHGTLGQLNLGPDTAEVISRALITLGTGAVLILVIQRYFQREGVSDNWVKQPNSERQLPLIGHSLDALAATLLAAPITWEHHYVLAIPLIIYVVIEKWEYSPKLVGLSSLLMIGIPTFDIYPISYHRLAGLLIWFYLTRPSVIDPRTQL